MVLQAEVMLSSQFIRHLANRQRLAAHKTWIICVIKWAKGAKSTQCRLTDEGHLSESWAVGGESWGCGRIRYANIMSLIGNSHVSCLIWNAGISDVDWFWCAWGADGLVLGTTGHSSSLQSHVYENWAKMDFPGIESGRNEEQQWSWAVEQSWGNIKSNCKSNFIIKSNFNNCSVSVLVQLVIWLVSYKVLFVSSG